MRHGDGAKKGERLLPDRRGPVEHPRSAERASRARRPLTGERGSQRASRGGRYRAEVSEGDNTA